MQLSAVFLALGEEALGHELRGVSLGRLRTYQLFDRVKTRLHLAKLNVESLRKAAPRLWSRLEGGDEDLAADLSQAILVSNLEMIREVLDFLGVPHKEGFFEKDLDVKALLTEGWQQRAWDRFHPAHPRPVLLFYLNHLAWELAKAEQPFQPAGAA